MTQGKIQEERMEVAAFVRIERADQQIPQSLGVCVRMSFLGLDSCNFFLSRESNYSIRHTIIIKDEKNI